MTDCFRSRLHCIICSSGRRLLCVEERIGTEISTEMFVYTANYTLGFSIGCQSLASANYQLACKRLVVRVHPAWPYMSMDTYEWFCMAEKMELDKLTVIHTDYTSCFSAVVHWHIFLTN